MEQTEIGAVRGETVTVIIISMGILQFAVFATERK